MIHAKLLMRRLAYVPWLLAAGLVLGWAGEAAAVDVTLSGEAKVREDASATDVAVKATVEADAAADIYVNLRLLNQQGLNTRFLITLPTLMIPKGKKEATGTVTFTPIPEETKNEDLSVKFTGDVGGTHAIKGSPEITLIDAHKETTEISLSFTPADLSKEAGPTEVTVTATVNGETIKNKSLSFSLVVVKVTTGVKQGESAEALRDRDYNITGLGTLIIPKKKVTGSETFTIDPKRVPTGKDGKGDTINLTGLVGIGGAPFKLTYDRKGLDGKLAPVIVKVNSSSFKIKDTPIAAGEGLTISQSMIREADGGDEPLELELTVELKTALEDDEVVTFRVLDDTTGTGYGGRDNTVLAERDTDYTAVVLEDARIPFGEKKGTATLLFDPIDNDGTNDAKALKVEATVGSTKSVVGILILDDETLTTEIVLSASPSTVTVGEGLTDVEITGTINGNTFEDAVTVVLVLSAKNSDTTAQRDTDFEAALRSLTIKAGQIEGSATIAVTALTGGDKKIAVQALDPAKVHVNDDDENVTATKATITLKDADPAAEGEAADPGALAFKGDADLSATVFDGVVGEEVSHSLPAATEGEGMYSYSVSALPAGLSFDPDTQTISGTPTAAGTTKITYTVIDGDGAAIAQTTTIEVSPPPPVPGVEVESISATRSSIREDDKDDSDEAKTTEITLTATLTKASDTAQMVSFTIGAPSSGLVEAVRDVDYTATLDGNVIISAGETQATTTLFLTPIDNGATEGNKSLGVKAEVGKISEQTADITIADDETDSTSITLSVNPHTISESESATDYTDVTVTATLNGKKLPTAAIVTLSVDGASVATRDVDYWAVFLNPTLTIPADSISGSTVLRISATNDGVDEGNETITLNGAINHLDDGSATITLSDAAAMPPSDPEMDPLAFAGSVDAQSYTAGTAASLELPEATDGAGGAVYTISGLPAGLAFDDSTRTVSGTPEAATEGAVEVTYMATDSDGTSISLTFSITVNQPLSFGDFFGLFSEGAGKANPASEHDEGVFQIVVGQPYSLTLPAASFGTPPLTYSVTGLPAGLSFDPATLTVSGTPTEVSEVVPVIYTVTDINGDSDSRPFLVAVVEPSLDAPDELVAADYKGADGAGDQGGFVLLTWDLSEHHDGIDGYRIFRELPVLNNEMVPWAMVDAVPGVEIGRAIVATLDNVATNWGIAAERGGQTTHGAAKAVLVRAENANPYELMAETMKASKEAAAVSDAPVLASLLPEALAFAQGAVPKLNLVAGVLESSAITLTEEPARAIDDIAPLAVPSISVLDAPNDQGSRILLTWTLSPSDQLLQGVITGAFGPATSEVVGVHGYSIYRRAASEDEFVLVAQVEAGVPSFVDETALNGVRYTYQVRAYDLDNEPGSDVEQTAMAVRNRVLDSEGRALYGLFGADNRIGFDDFFLFADNFGLTTEDAGFDPAFDLSPSAAIDFDDFFVFADNFGRSTAAAGKRVPMFAGLNADARLYLDARTTLPIVGEDFVLDVRVADFTAVKGYGLQVQYDASKLEFVEALTEQPLGGSELAAPQVLSDEAGVLALVAHGDVVSDGEVALSLVFRTTTEIENTVIEITDSETYDSEFGFNRLALPAPVALQTRPEAFGLANNYPNPFNPATTIKYALPTAADVELTVYNVVGQVVRTLVAEHQSAGRYVVEWDATNDNGHSLSSGMYFYRLEAGGEFLEVKKMLLLK